MNFAAARAVADAVMYEGYILYPYRASAAKNRSRWQFGVVMAPGYTAVDPSERDFAQTECVLERGAQTTVAVAVRFLQVQRRTSDGSRWDEAVEHELVIRVDFARLLDGGHVTEFEIPAGEEREGDVVRRRENLTVSVLVLATPLPGPWGAARLRVRVDNRTAPADEPRTRDEALPTALVAAHMIIGLGGGAFISMTDSPEWASAEVQACENIGCWPVLAGADGGRGVMLSTPIILYDHPELAPESPGDLYDGTEIDEILSLRTLALSDAEKQEARATDPRAAALIDRVEALGADDFSRMHGAIRSPRAAPGLPGVGHESAEPAGYGPGEQAGYDPGVPWWDPAADASVSPDTDAVTVAGHRVARGSLVTLRPGVRRSDAQDMFLDGRTARVEAVLLDVDDTAYLAVSLADDPDQDLRVAHGRFLYFSPDEVEPCQTP
ncbi:MAG TPA: hypothetical protein VH021_20435 [Trebonia sp.]|nr:hypothetical protein [Trebonia sp.]